ncbi:hypothetical protein D041_4285B, partial [Vibrio parahaemolyticus EKP-008]
AMGTTCSFSTLSLFRAEIVHWHCSFIFLVSHLPVPFTAPTRYAYKLSTKLR